MSPIVVDYTFKELLVAIKLAEAREYEANLFGCKHKGLGTDMSNPLTCIETHTLGTISEMMVKKWLGDESRLTHGTFKNRADVGDDVEVRTIRNPTHRLIIRPDDVAIRRYILTYTTRQSVTLLGWIEGYNGMVDEFAANPGGHGQGWFIPKEKLWDMESFER